MRVFWVAADICLMWDAARRQMSALQAAIKAVIPPLVAGAGPANV